MKKIFLYIVIGIILLAIPATLFLVGQRQDIRKRAAPATTLSLVPATSQTNVGDTFRLNVDIDPATNQVTTVKVYITYDVAVLEAQTITNGAIAPSVLNSGVIEGGIASITVGAASTTQPITTKGTAAIITFKAKAGTAGLPTAVQFTANTFVGGLNEPEANVLAGTVPANVTITGVGETSTITPTATPSASPTVTPTLTPALTPISGATSSAEASASAIQILLPANNVSVTSTEPTIQGKAPPGSTVTLTIYSAPQTVTVTADANGNWIYTPTTPLEPGPHNVVASIQTASGTTQTSTTSFVVAAAAESGATQSAIPVSGTIQTTILLIGLGFLLIISGTLIPAFMR